MFQILFDVVRTPMLVFSERRTGESDAQGSKQDDGEDLLGR
jgi:hypothetical protein